MDKLIKDTYGASVELFIHTDGCLDFSCAICSKENCPERKHPFTKKIEWSVANVISNKKHRV
jgi:hypothetical protein